MKGDQTRKGVDFKAANTKADIDDDCLDENKLTWHHHEDGETMQLVPQDIHEASRHTGGTAVVQEARRLAEEAAKQPGLVPMIIAPNLSKTQVDEEATVGDVEKAFALDALTAVDPGYEAIWGIGTEVGEGMADGWDHGLDVALGVLEGRPPTWQDAKIYGRNMIRSNPLAGAWNYLFGD